MPNRRQFLQTALGTAGLIGLQSTGFLAAGGPGRARAADADTLVAGVMGEPAIEPAARPLKLLILGGTGFIGPHQVEYAIARGHEVTMFNRGNRTGLYGDRVEEILGNRDTKIDEGLTPLQGDRTWDVVIDNSGYVPRHVRDSLDLLGGRCRRYIYVSTVAAYLDQAGHYDEDGPLDGMKDPMIEKVDGDTYGPLKADCDRLVLERMGTRATVVRPTFIVGPGDHTDRFTWWVDRIHRGGDVAGPPNPDVTVQTVDVRDLCPWLITLAENDTPGAFNAAGPVYTRAGLLWGIKGTTGGEVDFHWPSAALAAELEMPAPMLNWGDQSRTFGNAASRAAGLNYRPLADSTLATLAWWRSQSDERRANARGWPTPEQEAAVLARVR